MIIALDAGLLAEAEKSGRALLLMRVRDLLPDDEFATGEKLTGGLDWRTVTSRVADPEYQDRVIVAAANRPTTVYQAGELVIARRAFR